MKIPSFVHVFTIAGMFIATLSGCYTSATETCTPPIIEGYDGSSHEIEPFLISYYGCWTFDGMTIADLQAFCEAEVGPDSVVAGDTLPGCDPFTTYCERYWVCE